MKSKSVIFAVAGLAFPLVAAAQVTRNVPADFPTIQQAVTAALNGDTVLVAPGTYTEAVNLGGKRIRLRSSGGPYVTTINANSQASVITIGSGATRDTLVEGFTLTGGWHDLDAGGIRINNGSPTIRGNIIRGNLGGNGNGVSMSASAALIDRNTIADNHNSGGAVGGGGGGGIYIGGFSCPSPPADCGVEVRGNLIENNSALDYLSGGGIYVNGGGQARIVGNVIRNNRAPVEGGGIAFFNSSEARVENNLIVGNSLTYSSSEGGGVYWLVPSGSRGPYLVNNTIANNVAAAGSGVFADGFDAAARVVNNLIVGSPGSSALECGTFNDPNPAIVQHNNVVASGGPAYAGLCAAANGVQGNISQAPLFIAVGDYRLAATSPGIDAGDNSLVTEALDLTGAVRIVDGDVSGGAQVDMGAYEHSDDTIFVGTFQ